MSYLELLNKSAEFHQNIVCMGLDPVLERIPFSRKTISGTITEFYTKIYEALEKKRVYPSSVKPNLAFFLQYGTEGIKALIEVIELFKKGSIPVILDGKFCDIGNTSKAYSKAAFETFNADAVTANPYMGEEGVTPFFDKKDNHGVYVLIKTSNRSAGELQDLPCEHGGNPEPFFLCVVEKIKTWYKPGLGLVVGANRLNELDRIFEITDSGSMKFPLLIPGVGTQGGDLKNLMVVLKKSSNLKLHRINSSSAINYAYETSNNSDFASCASEALQKLVEEMNL